MPKGDRKEYHKKYRQENKEKEKERHKKYRQEHREEIREYAKKYYQEHREEYREYGREYTRQRRREDPKYRLDSNMTTVIWEALKDNKAGRHWENLVGYTLEKLMQRLSVNFTKGMTWENYGEWHIDHKKPKSWFKYESAEDKEFKLCWSLANLQPLWATENRKKSNSYKN